VAHYRRYYRPDNAVLVVAGDIDTERVVDRVNALFGAISNPAMLTSAEVHGSPVLGDRRVVVRGPGAAPLLQVCYPIPAASDPDYVPLSVAAAMLGGRRGRLHRALGWRVDASATMARTPFVLSVDVAPTRAAELDRVYATLQAEVDTLAADAAADVEAVKRRLRHAWVLGSEGATNQARLLGRYEMADSFERCQTYADDLQRVTADDVRRVVATYLAPERAVIGQYQRDNTRVAESPMALPLEHLHP
jgi:zinc protease